MELFKLFGSIFVNTDEAEKSMQKTTDKSEKLSEKLGKGIKLASQWGAAIVGGAAAAAAGLYKVATESAATADNIDKMSQKIGVSREAYQELDFICSQSGMSVDALQGGMKTLTAAMDGAANGTAKNVEEFEKLGISVKNADGSLRSQEDVMWETLTALQSMENQTEKARLATQLFGKSGSELMPMLNGASGSIDKMKKEAHDLGLVLSDETIDSGVTFTDTIDKVKRSFRSIITLIGADVMPIFQKVLDWVIDNMPVIQNILNKVFEVLKFVITSGINLLTDIYNVVQAHLPEIQALVNKVITTIVNVWNDYLKPCLNAMVQFFESVIVPTIKFVFKNVFEPIIKNAFELVGKLWEHTLKPILTGIITFLTGVFTGDWEKAFNGILSIVKGCVNGVITGFEWMVNSAIRTVNKILSAISTVASTVGSLIGLDPISLSISEINLPRLAKGGVLAKGQVGLLEGDGAEAVVPLDQNKKWISQVASEFNNQMGNASDKKIQQLIDVVSELTERLPDMMIEAATSTSFEINKREFARLVKEV